MANSDTRSERINIKILEELDNLRFVNRKKSYSYRIALFIKYYKKNKKTFEKWLEAEIKDESK